MPSYVSSSFAGVSTKKGLYLIFQIVELHLINSQFAISVKKGMLHQERAAHLFDSALIRFKSNLIITSYDERAISNLVTFFQSYGGRKSIENCQYFGKSGVQC